MTTCPNCQAAMNIGDHCPECDHEDDASCTCDHCLMCEAADDESYEMEES